MPIRKLDEAEIKKIAAKYIHSVHRNPASISEIQEVIKEALKKAAPGRELDEQDIPSVVAKLKGKSIINDKVINEVAKKVVDHAAMEDLKHMVSHHAERINKKKLTPEEIENIIRQQKLDPHKSALPTVRKAVEDYFKNKPVPATATQQEEKREKITRHTIKQGSEIPPKNLRNLTFFEKIRIKLYRYGIKSLTRGSRNWLEDEVSSLKRINRQKLLQEGNTIEMALIGKMFLYFYDAKLKKELPYWDKFPLVIPIEIYKDGWLGLNLHYLDRPLRTRLFDKLLQFANDKSLDKITKLRLSYGLLKNVSRYPEVRPCIKRYLTTHVRSELLKIEPIDWEIALFLPVEQFQKEKKETVWKKSKEKIRNLQRFRRR